MTRRPTALSPKTRANGPGMPRHPAHAKAALLEQPAERREREQPRVGEIEDAPLAVVELSDQQHQAR